MTVNGPSSTFPGVIALPYKLTTGAATEAFLSGLRGGTIVGSRCDSCSTTYVPAQDFCAPCRAATGARVPVAAVGRLETATEVDGVVFGLVRLDGADTTFVHRILAPLEAAVAGARVAVRWSAEPASPMLAIEGFVLGTEPEGAVGAPTDGAEEPTSLREIPYSIDLRYQHTYGWHYGAFFDELRTARRIRGSRCPQCQNVLVPPRPICEACYVRTANLVDIADTGTLQAFSIIELAFVGQRRNPPYIYAEIILDGSATRLIHTIDMDVTEARASLSPGARVKAVWRPIADAIGTLEDIEHFVVIDGTGALGT